MLMEVPGWMKKIRKKISVGAAESDLEGTERSNTRTIRSMIRQEAPFDDLDEKNRLGRESAILDYMDNKTKRKALAVKIRKEG